MAARSETLTFQGRDAWATWQVPFGLTEVGENGQLQLVKFRKDINAVADAHRFAYESKSRGRTTGGIWEAASNPADADNIIDGDLQTFWRPDPADAVEDWAIEIDLGRAVLAREIRLVFPDEGGCASLPPVYCVRQHGDPHFGARRLGDAGSALPHDPAQRGPANSSSPSGSPPATLYCNSTRVWVSTR